MAEPLIECVPNFSEGRRPEVIEAIAAAIRQTNGARLLDVDPGADYNRTVMTFVGGPQAVVEAAFAATALAARLIDMRLQHGGHPRLGATDVVPFVPVSGASLDDCAELARLYGARVAAELGIPVYLYEHAASRPERRNLATVRQGEYEGLADKLANPQWAPDFGPAVFCAQSGATIAGARPFLIAYNVNLKSADLDAANTIAYAIREIGTVKRDAAGNKLLDAGGKPERIPGRFKCVKALGVELPKQGIVQVSINLTDFHVSAPHVVYQAVVEEAAKLGIAVTGSEVVGLIPKEALLMAGQALQNDPAATEAVLIEAAIRGLGLADLAPFNPREKVIELLLSGAQP